MMNSSACQSKDRYIFVTEITVHKSSSEIFTDDKRYNKLLDKNDENDEKDEKDEDDNDS
jgi:hypothetical protein